MHQRGEQLISAALAFLLENQKHLAVVKVVESSGGKELLMEDDIHSRSRLAGYIPEILFNSSVLIVGAGALGQNLALNLALAGVGTINIVDFDRFEAHNATRSPLYPTGEEQVKWGIEKAKVVAQKLFPMMTAPNPKIRYAIAPIQSLGDLPIASTQLTFSAVDNSSTKAYLAERCRVIRRPLIEAGLHAEIFNLALFGPNRDEPCYLCLYPEKIGAFSCTRYALQLEERQFIPAIQNTAAILAGLQAEAGIQWLHNDHHLRNKRIYGNIRTISINTFDLLRSPECPGIHEESINITPIVLDVTADDTLEYLLKAVERNIGPVLIRFPELLVIRNFCTNCNTLTNAYVPEWQWLMSPLCLNCGGPFAPIEGRYLSSKTSVHSNDEEEILQLTCAQVGFPAGTTVQVWPDTVTMAPNSWFLMQIAGSIDQLMIEMASLDELNGTEAKNSNG